MTMGQTIFEWAPDSVAVSEINNLTKEITSYGSEDLFNSAEAQAANG
jgi:hypothetical protein